jgi:hypothetical protein
MSEMEQQPLSQAVAEELQIAPELSAEERSHLLAYLSQEFPTLTQEELEDVFDSLIFSQAVFVAHLRTASSQRGEYTYSIIVRRRSLACSALFL